MSVKGLQRSATFDEIMSQTSIIGALEKNKVAYVKLNSFVKDLDNKCVEKIIKIDQEKIQHKQYIYNLDRELRLNSRNFKKIQEQESQPKPLSELQRKLNDSSLPELITNENPYVKHIKFNAIDKDNSFLPVLIQNLQRQQHYSNLNLKEMIEKNKLHAQSLNFKRTEKKNNIHSIGNSNENFATFNTSVNNSHADFKDASHSHILSENQNPNDIRKLNRPKLNEEPTLSLIEFKSKHEPKNNLQVIRSIRRDRLSSREINEFYESKMNLLRIGRRFDKYRSKCTRRCEFKHASYVNLQNSTSPRRDDDDW